MSTFEIKMPKLGESITEGTIMRWAVKIGDMVQEDDILFEVSTEKVSAEIPSPVAGKVIEIRFSEGDVVPVGTVMAIVEIEAEVGKPEPDKVTEKAATPPPDSEKEETSVTPKAAKQDTAVPKSDQERFYSPLVRNIAKTENISQTELDSITGTGFQGRVNKNDVLQYLEARKKPGQKAVPSSEPSRPTIPVSDGDRIIEMDRVRRIIADHMVMSKKVSPHVTTIVEADVTKLVQWRNRVKDDFFHRTNVKLTFMPSITEACARALADFPQVNASVDGYNMILKKNINIGIAVALDNGNLIVPVIHHADQLNIDGLAIAIDSLANKARNNKLAPDDIQGGTFSITNFGTFKNIIGTPIINQPQVAVLGVGYVEKKPAVVETPDGDVIAIRHKMYLSLSYDHRIVDGALGGSFVRRVADYLEMERDSK